MRHTNSPHSFQRTTTEECQSATAYGDTGCGQIVMAMWTASAKLVVKCAVTVRIAHFSNSTQLTASTTVGLAAGHG